jgi:hypothetical protein
MGISHRPFISPPLPRAAPPTHKSPARGGDITHTARFAFVVAVAVRPFGYL